MKSKKTRIHFQNSLNIKKKKKNSVRLSIHVLYSRIIKQVKDYKYKQVYSAIYTAHIEKLERGKMGAYKLK